MASFGVTAFDGQANDSAGNAYTQAGGHPFDVATEIELNHHPKTINFFGFPLTIEVPDADTKDINVDLPPGLVGNPTGVGECTSAQLAGADNTSFRAGPTCPLSSIVGTVFFQSTLGDFACGCPVGLPLYNMERPADHPARFGFQLEGSPVFLTARVRSGSDYGLSVDTSDIPESLQIREISLTFWGVPADPSHDNQRCNVSFSDIYDTSTGDCGPEAFPGDQSTGSHPAGVPATALLTLPTRCTAPGVGLETTLHTDSWQDPGNFVDASFFSHLPPNYPDPAFPGPQQGPTGCAQVPFAPQISVQPTSHEADSPTGLHVELSLPQDGLTNPTGIATADLKKAVVDLPQGMSVDPSSVDGLGACTSAQAALNSDGPASCPDNAKIGTAAIDTPLLPEPVQGSIYLAKQGDNPFSSLLAIYIVASDRGVNIKLAGKVEPDPNTGQLETSFDNQPQLPFTDLKLDFNSGSRAPLTNPPTCGTKQVTTTMSPWSAADPNNPTPAEQRHPGDSFAINSGPNGSPCPADAAHRPFAPTMSAGTVNPAAGQFSPFVLRLQRSPGEQELTRIDATLPPGVLGKLAGVSQCSDATLNSIPTALGTGQAEIQNPACPANSRVGYAHIGLGSGAPFYDNTGRVYLAGPYKGAPLSLAIVTPAVAGPLDLGNVVVRSALNIDKSTAQIHVQSDPIPTILQGIPLDIRDLRVVLDRSNFTLNPTNCNVMSTTGSVGGAGGNLTNPADDTSAPVSDRFQVGGCAGLGFNPHLSTTLNGTRADTHRSSHPNLVFGLHANPGDANLASVAVTLPQAFQIDQANLGNICSETQLATNECAGRNTIGTASATTPLLDTPLSGPVYAVSGSGGLPKLAVILHGPPSMPIELVVRGITDTVGARIRNTFPLVPDAPITDFTLSINGGPGGYLVNNTELCPSTKASTKRKRKIRTGQRSDVVFTGQNGDTLTTSVPLTAPCGKARHKHRKHKRARHRR